MALDPVRNFAYGTLVLGISDTDTFLVISDSDASKFPNPSTDGAFNVVVYNYTDYFDPAEDPNVEIVRVTNAQSSGGNTTYTIQRGQEGTIAKNHNTSGKTYRIILAPTKKMVEDIETKVLSGLDANKPTIYKKDRFYWATDTKKLYWDNGSSWTDISAQFNVDKVDNKDASDFFQRAGTGEINALTEKTTLSDNDIVLIEDSEASYAKKKVKKSSLAPKLGAWVSKSAGTVYQATADGFVCAINNGSGGGDRVTGYCDGGNPPTTIRADAYSAATSPAPTLYIFFPTPKNEYWKVTISAGSATIYWIPLWS